MPPMRGDRLYVRLSASQARRRLKGVGYGVRKVESAGRGRSAILHTATGQNLANLRRLLADVLIDSDAPDDLALLRNLGPASAMVAGGRPPQ